MIGTPARSAPSRFATSKPSMSGSITSRTIRCGRNACTASSASPPVPAVSTLKPWKRRAIVMTSTMFGSASTTRIRFCSALIASQYRPRPCEFPGRRLSHLPNHRLAGMDDKVNLAEKLALLGEHYSPGIVGYMNDYKLVVVKTKGEFVWHKHDDTDDFF